MGIVVITLNNCGIINIIHWSSIKCQRIARSVLIAELFTIVYGFNIPSIFKDAAKAIFERDLKLCLYTDSKLLYDSLILLNSITEKRFLINFKVIREAYKCREVVKVFWIPGKQNPTDTLTKATKEISNALNKILETNKIKLTPNAWVKRKES